MFKGDIDPLVLHQHIMTLFHLHKLIEALSVILSDGCCAIE